MATQTPFFEKPFAMCNEWVEKQLKNMMKCRVGWKKGEWH